MASQEIDRLNVPSATDQERQLRKRRLIKGPKEFRDLRRNRSKTWSPRVKKRLRPTAGDADFQRAGAWSGRRLLSALIIIE
jgi:hypothetical protein